MSNEYEDLDELIKQIEEIKENGAGRLSLCKALYLVAKEIKEMKDLNKRIDDALNSYGWIIKN